jgi:CBS domain-containing protein
MQASSIIELNGRGIPAVLHTAKIVDVCAYLKSNSTPAALVLSDRGDVRGVMSEADIIGAAGRLGSSVMQMMAGELMREQAPVCQSDTAIVELLEILSETSSDFVLVTEGGVVKGLITFQDVAELLTAALSGGDDETGHAVEAEQPWPITPLPVRLPAKRCHKLKCLPANRHHKRRYLPLLPLPRPRLRHRNRPRWPMLARCRQYIRNLRHSKGWKLLPSPPNQWSRQIMRSLRLRQSRLPPCTRQHLCMPPVRCCSTRPRLCSLPRLCRQVLKRRRPSRLFCRASHKQQRRHRKHLSHTLRSSLPRLCKPSTSRFLLPQRPHAPLRQECRPTGRSCGAGQPVF